MSQVPQEQFAQTLDGRLRSLRLVRFRSEAFAHTKEWIRSALADLKIDLWLVTEHGEQSAASQVDEIHQQIEILEGALKPSIFDPDDKGSCFTQSAAADVAQYAICIVKLELGNQAPLECILESALRFLRTDDGRDEAHKCLNRVSSEEGIVFEDVGDVLQRAIRLLEIIGR